jgi:hemerythrin
MPLMQWSNSFSVHIRKIDEEHKKWIEFYNTLCHALSERQDQAVLGSLLADIVNYTNYHFETEENLFCTYGYPEYEQHKEEHEKIKNRFRKYKRVSLTVN